MINRIKYYLIFTPLWKGVGVGYLLLFLPFFSFSQHFTLDEALERALQQNKTLKVNEWDIRKQEKLVGTYKELPKTNVELQIGNIQQPFVYDYAFTAAQSFEMPSVYKARKKLLESYVQQAHLSLDLQQLSVKQQVRQAYYQLAYQQLLVKLLISQDSLFQKAAQKAAFRYNAGETNLLEKITLETQAKTLENRIQVSENQSQQAAYYLKQLLVIDTVAISNEVLNKKNHSAINAYDFPMLKTFSVLQNVNENNLLVEQQQLKPSFMGGVTNQSMEGSIRQFIVMGGINIPLFKQAPKARIEALQVEKNHIEAQRDALEIQLQTELKTLQNQWRTTQQTLDYLENSALPQADLLIKTAAKQYAEGEINYIEFQQSHAQALNIRETHLQQQLAQRQIETAINYLLGL